MNQQKVVCATTPAESLEIKLSNKYHTFIAIINV